MKPINKNTLVEILDLNLPIRSGATTRKDLEEAVDAIVNFLEALGYEVY